MENLIENPAQEDQEVENLDGQAVNAD